MWRYDRDHQVSNPVSDNVTAAPEWANDLMKRLPVRRWPMATTGVRRHHLSMLVMRPVPERGRPDGAWWPQSRSLAAELAKLVAMWPHDVGRIERVRFSLADWDDRPQAVAIAGRWIRAGAFPHDDSRLITVMLSDLSRRQIEVIPSEASREVARHTFNEVTGIHRVLNPRRSPSAEHVDWGDESGYA